MTREPNAIIDAIVALLTVAAAFGYNITPAQHQAIVGLALAVLVLVTWIVGLLEKRKRVTPVEAPQLPAGTRVVVTEPDPQPGQDPVQGSVTIPDLARRD